MCHWILKSNGKVVPRRTHRPLTTAERHSNTEQRKRRLFDDLIEERWGTSINPSTNLQSESFDDFEEYEDNHESKRIIPDIEDAVDANGRLLNQQPAYDKLINSEVQLQHGDHIAVGTVRQRAIGPNGTTHGTYDDNPILNSIIYEVEFPDGQVKDYAANVIAENILSQVDDEGFSNTLLASILDYKCNPTTAIS